ncbi:MAG: hypothetical protein FWH47_05770 [Methanomassiliicoccaceae archaeon]|nr:hypothetical protein [Methanomassiliicoccaceae archaeon]
MRERPAEWRCDLCGSPFPSESEAGACEERCMAQRNIDWEGRALKRVARAPRAAGAGVLEAVFVTETTVVAVGRRLPSGQCYNARTIVVSDDRAIASTDSVFDPLSLQGADGVEITMEEYEEHRRQAAEKFAEITKGTHAFK